MNYEYDGPGFETVGRGVDLEFGCDPEREAVLEIQRKGDEFATAEKLVANSVVALVKQGHGLREAAEAVGQTLEAVKYNSIAREALRKLNREYELNDAELRQLVKGKAVELALQSDDLKLSLDATKLIAQMPDVGLTGSAAKVNIAVGVFSDETNKVLASIDPNEDQHGKA